MFPASVGLSLGLFYFYFYFIFIFILFLFLFYFSVPYFGLACDHGNSFLCLEE